MIHCIFVITLNFYLISELLNYLHSTVKYRRIFPVESLSKVENPWKGITLNRCLLVAMVVVVVSSTVEIVQGEFLNVSYAVNMCACKLSQPINIPN